MYRYQAIALARRLYEELGATQPPYPLLDRQEVFKPPDWAVAAILQAYDQGVSQGKATLPLPFSTPANLRCPRCGSDPPIPNALG